MKHSLSPILKKNLTTSQTLGLQCGYSLFALGKCEENYLKNINITVCITAGIVDHILGWN